nr:MAG TPA: hypothetical protein [Caudoviricetes sp.]
MVKRYTLKITAREPSDSGLVQDLSLQRKTK